MNQEKIKPLTKHDLILTNGGGKRWAWMIGHMIYEIGEFFEEVTNSTEQDAVNHALNDFH